MNKEKLGRLVKYAEDLKAKLSSPLPEKHKHSPDTYKQFLTRELEAVTNQLERARLSMDNKK